MSITAFATITGALVELLQVDPPVSANIFRARDRTLAEQYDDAINIQFDGAKSYRGAITGAPVDWNSQFTIECWARTSSTSPDLAVDALLGEIYRRIAVDTTLGGLIGDIGDVSILAEYTEENKKTGWVRMTFPMEHRTSNLKLEQP